VEGYRSSGVQVEFRGTLFLEASLLYSSWAFLAQVPIRGQVVENKQIEQELREETEGGFCDALGFFYQPDTKALRSFRTIGFDILNNSLEIF
jgi:hypothetical protein